jgi:hypothetical protein
MIRVTEADIGLGAMRALPRLLWFIGKIPTASNSKLICFGDFS